jgi:hypothetical protein
VATARAGAHSSAIVIALLAVAQFANFPSMSWTEAFPVFTDAQVEEALGQFSPDDEAVFQNEFGIDSVSGRTGVPGGHLLVFSLFCKATSSEDGEVAGLTAEMLKAPADFGLKFRHNPWDHYVEPLLQHGPAIVTSRPDLTLRIYLAQDLKFLVPMLAPFAEVVVMKGSSVRSAPGMLWRFLPLDEGRYVTVLDADLASTSLIKIRVTERLFEAGLGYWRIPVPFDLNSDNEIIYRTMAGCYWGCRVQLPITDLLKAFRWQQIRNQVPRLATHPWKLRKFVLFGSNWPDYGSDEYFKNLVLFPRLAESGTLTIMHKPSRSWLLPLDIEYITWANRNSVVNYSLYPHVAAHVARDEEGKELPRRKRRFEKPGAIPFL